MTIINTQELSPREYQLQQYEKEMYEKHTQHELAIKRLEIEVLKTEARITSWFKIPITIIKLPVLILFGIAYIVSMITKKELPEQFWNFMRGN